MESGGDAQHQQQNVFSITSFSGSRAFSIRFRSTGEMTVKAIFESWSNFHGRYKFNVIDHKMKLSKALKHSYIERDFDCVANKAELSLK